MLNKIKSLSTGTMVRTTLQILAYVNQVIAVLGNTTYASSEVYQWASVIVTILVTIFSYWYNNDWTNLAQSTGDIYNMVKDGDITKEELDKFINEHKGKGDINEKD